MYVFTKPLSQQYKVHNLWYHVVHTVHIMNTYIYSKYVAIHSTSHCKCGTCVYKYMHMECTHVCMHDTAAKL